MTQAKIIEYWNRPAERDWKAVLDLSTTHNFVHALFFAHLVIEKLLKAHWVKENGPTLPPITHNLEFLLSQTNLSMPVEDIDELRVINAWNIEGRYQDYKDMLYKLTTKEYTEEKLKIVNRIRKWLIEQLQ